MQTEAKDFWRLFKVSSCSVRLEGTSKDEVFEELIENFIEAGALREDLREAALQALLARETIASTGVGQRVAIPHVKLVGLDEAVLSLSIHPGGVEWDSLDGEPVSIFFTVLRPERATERYHPDRHLDIMRWISLLSRDNDFRRFVVGATTRKDLLDLLREKSV